MLIKIFKKENMMITFWETMHLIGYQNGLASKVQICFDRIKKGPEAMKNEVKGVENEPVANELTKQIIWKFVTKK